MIIFLSIVGYFVIGFIIGIIANRMFGSLGGDEEFFAVVLWPLFIIFVALIGSYAYLKDLIIDNFSKEVKQQNKENNRSIVEDVLRDIRW